MDTWSKRIFIGLLILIFSCSLIPGVSASTVHDSKVDQIDAFVNSRYINTKIKGLELPFAALVIVQGDQIVHLKAFVVPRPASCANIYNCSFTRNS